MNTLKKLKPRGTLILEIDGVKVIDENLARLLLLIRRKESILSAAKALNIPYSRAWEAIAKAERILNIKLIEPKRGGRGGGGAKLTSRGEEILNRYLEEYRRLFNKRFSIEEVEAEAPEIVYAGSNDPLLEHIMGFMRDQGVESIEIAWIGSTGGLTLLMLKEADLAGIHLYDPETGEYNLPYLSKYWLETKAILVRGYEREIGFAFRKHFDDPLNALVTGEAKIVNRNLGSGTRVRLDYLLKRKAEEMGKTFRELVKSIKGYENEVKTHLEVVREIIAGKADLGLTIRWAAEKYGLKFKSLGWEKFDFAISLDSYKRPQLRKFLKILSSKDVRNLAEELRGYRVGEDCGKVIYEP